MKRHHEDNPYTSTDSGSDSLTTHSVPKRMAIRNNSQSNSANSYTVDGNYSPPSSNGSDSSSSTTTNSTSSSNSIHNQLCRCPNKDCVIHDYQNTLNIPEELKTNTNPIYGNQNLLLYYAHLERCRRHGQNIHFNTSEH